MKYFNGVINGSNKFAAYLKNGLLNSLSLSAASHGFAKFGGICGTGIQSHMMSCRFTWSGLIINEHATVWRLQIGSKILLLGILHQCIYAIRHDELRESGPKAIFPTRDSCQLPAASNPDSACTWHSVYAISFDWAHESVGKTLS